jgi:hypothetical protein
MTEALERCEALIKGVMKLKTTAIERMDMLHVLFCQFTAASAPGRTGKRTCFTCPSIRSVRSLKGCGSTKACCSPAERGRDLKSGLGESVGGLGLEMTRFQQAAGAVSAASRQVPRPWIIPALRSHFSQRVGHVSGLRFSPCGEGSVDRTPFVLRISNSLILRIAPTARIRLLFLFSWA